MLGYFDISPQGYDSQVAATAIRDGNFDYLTNTTHWAPTNTSHALQTSLYRITAPDFFSGYAWPWVDPTGTDRNLYTLPAKARFDAGVPIPPP